MMLRRYAGLLLCGLLLLPGLVLAQGVPDQVNIALERLGGEVNRNLTLNDLDNWRWAQDLYPDMSLGCPQPDAAYAQISTQGFKFLLTYEGVVYDYRVSADGSTVILCSQTSESEAAGATPTVVDAETVDTTVACPDPEPGVVYLPQRLTSGIQAQVVAGPPIIQRSEPSDNGAVIGEIPGQAVLNIAAGPVCAEGQLWWQVDYDGRAGWTVEGRDGSYWLEAVPALPLPAGLAPMDAQNAGQVAELSRVEANVAPALAAAPDSDTVAVLGGAGVNGVWLYTLSALDTAPGLLRGTVQLTDVGFGPAGDLLLLGDVQGGIRLWAADAQVSLLERWFDQGHETLTTAVAFSPDAQTVASVGDVAVTNVPVEPANAILLWDIDSVSQQAALGGHTGQVNALAFSPDGALLASAGEDQTVRLWDAADAAEVAVLEGHSGPVVALAFSPDGALLVTGSSSGEIILWDVQSQEQVSGIGEAGLPVAALAFSPDGALLASAGGDEAAPNYAIRLWDVESTRELARLSGHTDVVGGLAFSADGTVLVSVGEDRSVRFWGVGG